MGKRHLILCAFVALALGLPATAQLTGFKNLRFDEDWSALADEGVETSHLFPVLKWIDIGEEGDWALSTGGQLRWRGHRESNRNLMGNSPQVNDFSLLRTRLHAELRHADGFRVFVEMLDARIYNEDRPPLPIDRNHADVQNAFVEFTEGDTTFRAGRFELEYGVQRFVSPLEWGNTRRRFEGVLARQQLDEGKVDFFITHPVPVDPQHTDHDDDSLWFSGAYYTLPHDGGGTDLYALSLNETTPSVTSGSGRTGPFDVYTVGARRWDKHGQFDWEGELALQFGQYAGDQVQAESVTLRAGWTEPDCWGAPRFGLDLDYASGDSDPTDSRRETFNQLFPLGHAWLGKLDLVARQNIIAIQPNVLFSVGPRTKVKLEQHFFRLADRHDALYNAGGGTTLVDPTGNSGKEVGREFDIIVSHNLEAFAPHATVVVGYSRFDPGEFVENTGSRKDANLLYTQLTFTF